MRCRRVSLTSFRLATAILTGSLALAACSPTGDATSVADPPEENPPVEDDNGPVDPVDEPEPAEPTEEEAVTASYEAFLQALTAAMEEADPDLPLLAEHADGAGLVSAQAMVVSLTTADRIARGEFVPSIESIEIDGDTAELQDCYRADILAYDADTDEQVADRGGSRFEGAAELQRADDGWVVTDFAQGDVCAPAVIAGVVEDRYLAFWDAVWSAADPPDPDHPGLVDTAAGEHLAGVQAQLTSLREEGRVRRGRGSENPVVSYVTAHDTEAVVLDCVEENPDGGLYDAATGERVEGGTAEGQRTLLETRLEVIDDLWKVVNVSVLEEDSSCVPE